jgi:prepilin-type N-terminal cleavage/methylation domain-containing protein
MDTFVILEPRPHEEDAMTSQTTSVREQGLSLRGFSLVEMLVVIVIIAILAAILMPRYLGSARTAAGKPATAMARAHDTECLMNIRSVRQAIEVFKTSDTDTKNPPSLTELRLPAELLQCPVGKVPYVYDPATGQVHCPYPGHESF